MLFDEFDNIIIMIIIIVKIIIKTTATQQCSFRKGLALRQGINKVIIFLSNFL